MVFGARENENAAAPTNRLAENENHEIFPLPFSCRTALIIAAIPVFVLGFYIPQPLQNLLSQAAAVLTNHPSP
jgi:hypothetical protein